MKNKVSVKIVKNIIGACFSALLAFIFCIPTKAYSEPNCESAKEFRTKSSLVELLSIGRTLPLNYCEIGPAKSEKERSLGRECFEYIYGDSRIRNYDPTRDRPGFFGEEGGSEWKVAIPNPREYWVSTLTKSRRSQRSFNDIDDRFFDAIVIFVKGENRFKESLNREHICLFQGINYVILESTFFLSKN